MPRSRSPPPNYHVYQHVQLRLEYFVANIKKLFYELNVQLCQIFLKYFISFLASTRNNNLQDQECDTIVIPNEFQMCQ